MGKFEIIEFHDYRSYLSDYLQRDGALSSRQLARRTGVSHSYFSMILRGQRNLAPQKTPMVAEALGLAAAEAEHFYNLVILADSRDVEKRNEAMKHLQKTRGYRGLHSKEFEAYKYLEKWQYVAIRELVELEDFQYDPDWIRKRLLFPLRSREVLEALNFLTTYGFIEQRRGRWVQTQKNLRCVGGVYSLSLQNFHNLMLDLASQAMTRFRRPEREQTGYTFAINSSDWSEAQKIFAKALKDIKSLEKRSLSKNQVYHMNISAFPLSKAEEGT